MYAEHKIGGCTWVLDVTDGGGNQRYCWFGCRSVNEEEGAIEDKASDNHTYIYCPLGSASRQS